ncbi:hypothetical protein ZWY2020_025847 [Hordeum vulgare]|nr:hypothetical protein ZWY2020_025847 [Hordeum vulgare]
MRGRTATFFKGSLLWTLKIKEGVLDSAPVAPGFVRFRLEDESFSMVPAPPCTPRLNYKASNLTENDRASIVGDAIEYIDELNRTVKELKILVEQKWHGTNRRKIRKLDEEAAADGESSSMRPMRDEQDNQLDGAIRSSWVQRRSKECHVDVQDSAK